MTDDLCARLRELAADLRKFIGERFRDPPPSVEADAMDEAADRIESLQTKVERLREALEPFADFADPRGQVPGEMHITPGSYLAKRQLMMSDCYKAVKALDSLKDGSDK